MIRFVLIDDKTAIVSFATDLDAEEIQAFADQIRERLPDWRFLVLGDEVVVTDLRGAVTIRKALEGASA